MLTKWGSTLLSRPDKNEPRKYHDDANILGNICGFFENEDTQNSAQRNADLPKCNDIADVRDKAETDQNQSISGKHAHPRQ